MKSCAAILLSFFLFTLINCQNDQQQSDKGAYSDKTDQRDHKHKNSQSPYAGQQNRDLKAFPPQVIKQLKRGSGMPFYGMAKPAELNSFPGPKHILESWDTLQLTPEQVDQVQAVYDTMQKQAVEVGQQLLRNEQKLDSAFANERIQLAKLKKFTAKSGTLYGKLRRVHLNAHLKARSILEEQQIERYDQWRGYTD
jgi:Spy/CpxP family protein refolding chaperone